jgi:hypothetical protein
LDQTQNQLTPVVHHHEVVKVKEIEGRQAESGSKSRLEQTVTLDQLIGSVGQSESQVDGTDHRAEDDSSFSEQ